MPCSPRRRIRLVTVAGGLTMPGARLGSKHLRRLDTSNGCQDHTVLPSAIRLHQEALRHVHIRKTLMETKAAPFVLRAGRSLTDQRPALRSPRATTLPRPPHPAPNVRDDRDTPPQGAR